MRPHVPVGIALATALFGRGPRGGHVTVAHMSHGSALTVCNKDADAAVFCESNVHNSKLVHRVPVD